MSVSVSVCRGMGVRCSGPGIMLIVVVVGAVGAVRVVGVVVVVGVAGVVLVTMVGVVEESVAELNAMVKQNF